MGWTLGNMESNLAIIPMGCVALGESHHLSELHFPRLEK